MKTVEELSNQILDDISDENLSHYDGVDDSSNALEHYGILGMKWGVRKDRRKKKDRRYPDETDQEYQNRMNRESQERQAKAAAKERAATQRATLKSQERQKRMDLRAQEKRDAANRKSQERQKREMTKQQELEYKERKRTERQKTRSKPTNERTLNDKELKDAIQRLRDEQTYRQLSIQNKSLPKRTVIKAATVGGGILLAVGTAIAKKQLTEVGNQKASAYLQKKGLLKDVPKNQQQGAPTMDDIRNLVDEMIKASKGGGI